MSIQLAAGTKLHVGTTASTASSDTYTEIGSLNALPEVGDEYDDVPFENLGTATYEHNTGAVNHASIVVGIGRDLTDAGQVAVRAANGVNSYYNWKVTYPDGTKDYFKAKVQGFKTAPGGMTGNLMASIKLQPKPGSGSLHNAGAAPANSVLPAISGLLTTGATLTAYPGVWTQPATFTYQWKNAGVAISGETAATYTIAAGDSGDSLTVTVTATNPAGSASATSAPVVGA